jgi:fibro-slime domain-containing protein
LFVFINEKLAVDVGGLHPELVAAIDMSHPTVQAGLGLKVGEFYALDIFHAERHSSGSNFKITTSLVPGCNIVDAGKLAYSWVPSNLAQDWKLVGGPTWGIVSGNNIKLTDSSVYGSVAYAFLRNQVNVGAGFVIRFSFTASSKGEGFVFAIQRDTITDLGGGSGGNLGFRDIKKSIGIAFDFCGDRLTSPNNPTCTSRDVRLHYNLNSPETPNSVTSASTKKLRAQLIHPNELNDGVSHTVEIRYFDKSPPWLEVFIDDDLFLQKRNIDVEKILGGRNAFIGFTAATGGFQPQSASTILITDMTVSTIAIEDKNARTLNIPQTKVEALANGREKLTFLVKTNDFCFNSIEFGGAGDRARGILERVDDSVPSSRRRLVQSSFNISTKSPDNLVEAIVVDLQNGQYSLNFSTTKVGNYSLNIWYGKGCFLNNQSFPTTPTPTCFYEYKANIAAFTPVPPPVDNPVEQPDTLPQAVLTGVGVAAGVVSFFGLALVAFGLRKRNQWRKEKDFIDAGKRAVAERGVQYTGDTDLDILQNKLQGTLHALQQERARSKFTDDKQSTINELLRQKGELQEHVRRLKILRDGGDPDVQERRFSVAVAQNLGGRVRKSFAAVRASRGFSLRFESPVVRDADSSSQSGITSSRFNFPRFSRKGPPPPVPQFAPPVPARDATFSFESANPIFRAESTGGGSPSRSRPPRDIDV